MYLSKTKKRLLQWSMLSVLIAMLSPVAYAACPHGDFSSIKKITHGSKSYPKNAKGAVFLFHRSHSVGLNAYQRHEAEYWQHHRYSVLPDIPTPLTADRFQIIDKTNNKQLTPKLVRLSALDTYPIHDRDNGYALDMRYYIKTTRMSGCEKDRPFDGISYKEFTKLFINEQLVEVTNEVKKAWGYFRVEPEEGLQVGHTYEFSYIAGEVINGKKLPFVTVMKIGPEPIDLETLVPKIQPVEYEDFSNSRHRNFVYWSFGARDFALYGRTMRYYLPPSLRQYDRQLQMISQIKFNDKLDVSVNPFVEIYLTDDNRPFYGNEFMIKRFRGSNPAQNHWMPNEYYPVVHFPYIAHKAQVGFLEIDDQLYDTQTKTFFTGESGLYD